MKKYLIFLIFFLFLFFIVFRNLYINITTNLVDWFDYPTSAWLINQNMNKILSLDFHNFFDTNIYYPHKYTLLFADTTLPQAILGLLPFFLTKNLILSFNIMFLLNFILNFTSVYLFWRQIFKKDLIAFFGSLLFIFSPFFHIELSHLPMMSYWPFFFSLYFLFKYEKSEKTENFIFTGLFITIQFLANVYLSVYLIFSILIFYALRLLSQKGLKPVMSKVSIIFLVFILTAGVFIKGYVDMKNTYNIKRDIKEYITYSANLSDYIFTSKIKSFIHQSEIMQIWNKADKNVGAHSSFPGFLIFTLALFSLFKISKTKNLAIISLEINREKAFFLILIMAGFLFSLGPRLKFNGNYAHIPLPYTAVLKFIPMLEATRVPNRWSFLFFLGFTYFSLISLNRLTNKSYHKIAFLLISIIFILEYIPFNLQTAKNNYITHDYQLLKNICSNNKKVLLELPVTHLDAAPNIYEGLKYITTLVFASTYHECFLVNGYSGYDLPENFTISALVSKYIADNDTKAFIAEMQKREIDIVKFNQNYFIKELKPFINDFIAEFSTKNGVEKINEDLYSVNR